MSGRIIAMIISGLILLGLLGWLFLGDSSPLAPSPTPSLSPESREQNAEALIEARSKNVKNNLDQTRDATRQYQHDVNTLLEE